MIGKTSATIDTRFEVVDDLFDGVDVFSAQRSRIDALVGRLPDTDDTLRSIRALCGVAQKDIASELGVSASAVAQLESRDLETTQLGTLRRYFSALGYDLTISVTPVQDIVSSVRS
jgi:DNA-binding XRE family transcriptional regulator